MSRSRTFDQRPLAATFVSAIAARPLEFLHYGGVTASIDRAVSISPSRSAAFGGEYSSWPTTIPDRSRYAAPPRRRNVRAECENMPIRDTFSPTWRPRLRQNGSLDRSPGEARDSASRAPSADEHILPSECNTLTPRLPATSTAKHAAGRQYREDFSGRSITRRIAADDLSFQAR